jgi:hypothetical protein
MGRRKPSRGAPAPRKSAPVMLIAAALGVVLLVGGAYTLGRGRASAPASAHETSNTPELTCDLCSGWKIVPCSSCHAGATTFEGLPCDFCLDDGSRPCRQCAGVNVKKVADLPGLRRFLVACGVDPNGLVNDTEILASWRAGEVRKVARLATEKTLALSRRAFEEAQAEERARSGR